MYERSKRGKTLPDVDTCSFARMFQQAMQEYTSSTQLFNPQALVKEFITRYMPHEKTEKPPTFLTNLSDMKYPLLHLEYIYYISKKI